MRARHKSVDNISLSVGGYYLVLRTLLAAQTKKLYTGHGSDRVAVSLCSTILCRFCRVVNGCCSPSFAERIKKSWESISSDESSEDRGSDDEPRDVSAV